MATLTITERRTGRSRPSAASRLVNTVIDPLHAFGSLDEHSPWLLALVATIVLRFGSLFVFYHPAVTPLKVIGGVAFQILTVVPAVLIAAIAVWVAGCAWRCRVRWRAVVTVTMHAYFAFTLATVVAASVAGALLPASVDVDLRHPPFTNFSAVGTDSLGPVLRSMLATLDVRWAYALGIVWLGLRACAPPEVRGRAGHVVATILAARVVLAVGSALFSR